MEADKVTGCASRAVEAAGPLTAGAHHCLPNACVIRQATLGLLIQGTEALWKAFLGLPHHALGRRHPLVPPVPAVL